MTLAFKIISYAIGLTSPLIVLLSGNFINSLTVALLAIVIVTIALGVIGEHLLGYYLVGAVSFGVFALVYLSITQESGLLMSDVLSSVFVPGVMSVCGTIGISLGYVLRITYRKISAIFFK